MGEGQEINSSTPFIGRTDKKFQGKRREFELSEIPPQCLEKCTLHWISISNCFSLSGIWCTNWYRWGKMRATVGSWSWLRWGVEEVGDISKRLPKSSPESFGGRWGDSKNRVGLLWRERRDVLLVPAFAESHGLHFWLWWLCMEFGEGEMMKWDWEGIEVFVKGRQWVVFGGMIWKLILPFFQNFEYFSIWVSGE